MVRFGTHFKYNFISRVSTLQNIVLSFQGKLYVYELRAMKSPKHSISAHQGAITCITEQNTAKVGIIARVT